MTRLLRAIGLPLCLLTLLVGGAQEASAALDPIPLPIKMPSPALVRGFNQIAASQEGGAPAALHAAVFITEQHGWPTPAMCRKMPFGCWPSITSQWSTYKLHVTDDPMRFRDAGDVQEFFFKVNQMRPDYAGLRTQLYILYSGGALPGQLPNRAMQYASIDEAVNWTIKYFKYLQPRMQRVLSKKPHRKQV